MDQGLVVAATIAMGSVLSIVAPEITGHVEWAGVPAAVYALAQALAALLWAVTWDRLGRRNSMTLALLAGLVGGVTGALAVELQNIWILFAGVAVRLEWNELAGPLVIAVPLFGVAATVAFVGLRPRRVALPVHTAMRPLLPAGRPLGVLLREGSVAVAIVTVLATQTVVVMLMGITSLHTRSAGFGLGEISSVFAANTLGMFAFSPLAGLLADHLG